MSFWKKPGIFLPEKMTDREERKIVYIPLSFEKGIKKLERVWIKLAELLVYMLLCMKRH